MSTYLKKLEEYLLVGAEYERLKVESIAAKEIPFIFEDKTYKCSKLWLEVPKALKQYL